MGVKIFACHQCNSTVIPDSGKVAACAICGAKYGINFKRLSGMAALPIVYVFAVTTFKHWLVLLGGLLIGMWLAFVFDKKGWKWKQMRD